MRQWLFSKEKSTRCIALAILVFSATGGGFAQTTQTPVEPPAPSTQEAPPPQGTVIIQSHGDPPSLPDDGTMSLPAATDHSPVGAPRPAPALDQTTPADLTDADRSSVLITSYDLDLRLRPATAGLSARARLTVQNTGAAPLKYLALQISSSLHWESAALTSPESSPDSMRLTLPVAQHVLDTDADHTGAETELILALPQPLAPGASAGLDLFYAGTVNASAARLQRLGASDAQQRSTDWDAVSPAWTGLRGFGNVLWYPVASPQLFLGDGNALFQAAGRTRLREQQASVRLRLSVEYGGSAPVAAYFCGRRQSLTAVADSPNSPTEAGAGVATAIFGAEPLGFRTLNLFLLQQPEIFSDPTGTSAPSSVVVTVDSALGMATAPQGSPDRTSSSSSSSSSSSQDAQADTPATQPLLRRTPSTGLDARPFLAMEGADSATAQLFSAAAYPVSPVLRQWLGPVPLSALTAVDHEGQPFQDGPLLIAPLPVLAQITEAPALVQSLTHAWVQTGQPWMDEGLPQFFALLFTEQQSGRETAVAQLNELMKPVALGEPDPTNKTPTASAEPLVAATSELIYRRKAAAVWWMLRGIVGDGNLHAALGAWCTQQRSLDPPATQAVTFERLLERISHQDLGWFFADWILADKGLPDLTIADIAVVEEPTGPGHPAGWLVAVTVRNEGGATAEVPLVVHSGPLTVTHRVRVAGLSTVTERVLVEAAPTSVTLNDGGTPEVRLSTHTSEVHVQVK